MPRSGTDAKTSSAYLADRRVERVNGTVALRFGYPLPSNSAELRKRRVSGGKGFEKGFGKGFESSPLSSLDNSFEEREEILSTKRL
mgnify:CR=1 FL=1